MEQDAKIDIPEETIGTKFSTNSSGIQIREKLNITDNTQKPNIINILKAYGPSKRNLPTRLAKIQVKSSTDDN